MRPPLARTYCGMIGRGNSLIAGGVQLVPANGSKLGITVVDVDDDSFSSLANKWRLHVPNFSKW